MIRLFNRLIAEIGEHRRVALAPGARLEHARNGRMAETDYPAASELA